HILSQLTVVGDSLRLQVAHIDVRNLVLFDYGGEPHLELRRVQRTVPGLLEQRRVCVRKLKGRDRTVLDHLQEVTTWIVPQVARVGRVRYKTRDHDLIERNRVIHEEHRTVFDGYVDHLVGDRQEPRVHPTDDHIAHLFLGQLGDL